MVRFEFWKSNVRAFSNVICRSFGFTLLGKARFWAIASQRLPSFSIYLAYRNVMGEDLLLNLAR